MRSIAKALAANGMHPYAYCQRGMRSTLLALNLENTTKSLRIGRGGKHYMLSNPDMQSKTVLLNGKRLELDGGGTLPATTRANGSLAPFSVNFITLPQARNAACSVN